MREAVELPPFLRQIDARTARLVHHTDAHGQSAASPSKRGPGAGAGAGGGAGTGAANGAASNAHAGSTSKASPSLAQPKSGTRATIVRSKSGPARLSASSSVDVSLQGRLNRLDALARSRDVLRQQLDQHRR